MRNTNNGETNTLYRKGFRAVHPFNQLNPPKPVRRSETAADHGSDKTVIRRRAKCDFAFIKIRPAESIL